MRASGATAARFSGFPARTGRSVERADGSHALRITSEALETLSRLTKIAEDKGLVHPVKG